MVESAVCDVFHNTKPDMAVTDGKLTDDFRGKLKTIYKGIIASEITRRQLLPQALRNGTEEVTQTKFERALEYLEGKRHNPNSFIQTTNYLTEIATKNATDTRQRKVDKLMQQHGGIFSPLLGEEYTLQNYGEYHSVNQQFTQQIENTHMLANTIITSQQPNNG